MTSEKFVSFVFIDDYGYMDYPYPRGPMFYVLWFFHKDKCSRLLEVSPVEFEIFLIKKHGEIYDSYIMVEESEEGIDVFFDEEEFCKKELNCKIACEFLLYYLSKNN